MKTIRQKLAALLVAVLAVTGLSLVSAAPAQAFNSFTYYANCPGIAKSQQLVVRNYSGSHIQIYRTPPFYPTTGPHHVYAAPYGGVWYIPVVYDDVAHYQFSGFGNLNWYYHVDCFY